MEAEISLLVTIFLNSQDHKIIILLTWDDKIVFSCQEENAQNVPQHSVHIGYDSHAS